MVLSSSCLPVFVFDSVDSLIQVTYLWNATKALAFKTDSFLCNGSQAGNDHRKRPRRSMLPDCCNTSHTHATCSWVKPNVGNNTGDNELGIVVAVAIAAVDIGDIFPPELELFVELLLLLLLLLFVLLSKLVPVNVALVANDNGTWCVSSVC